MGYELSKKKSGVSKKWEDQKFLMIGKGGIGKSSFWQYADDVGYIETEAGLNFIDACKNPARDWSELGSIIKALGDAAKSGNFPYKTVVLDTIDRADDYAKDATLKYYQDKYPEKGIKTLGDVPGIGTAWDLRRSMTFKVLKALEKLPCAIVIIGHLETKNIEEAGQKAYDRNTLSISGKTGQDILHWSDHTLHVVGKLQGDVLKRTVYTKPTQSREAKSRGGLIKDGWVWGDNDEENFKKLRSCFE